MVSDDGCSAPVLIDLLNRVVKKDFRMHYSFKELAMANGLLTLILTGLLLLVYFGYNLIIKPQVWLVGSILIWAVCLACTTHCMVEKKEFGDVSAIMSGLNTI